MLSIGYTFIIIKKRLKPLGASNRSAYLRVPVSTGCFSWLLPDDRSKSWLDIGGRKALTLFNGAPHKPGTRYTVNERHTNCTEINEVQIYVKLHYHDLSEVFPTGTNQTNQRSRSTRPGILSCRTTSSGKQGLHYQELQGKRQLKKTQ